MSPVPSYFLATLSSVFSLFSVKTGISVSGKIQSRCTLSAFKVEMLFNVLPFILFVPSSFLNGVRVIQPLIVAVCSLAKAGCNGNQPLNRATLQQVSDMSGGDKDSGSFYHLAEILAGSFTLGSGVRVNSEQRTAWQRGSPSPKASLVSVSRFHGNRTCT